MDKDNMLELVSLEDVLIRTSYMVVITAPEDKKMEKPIGHGSGFILNYKDYLFFVTADHVSHPDDHDNQKRTGRDFVVSIFNNLSDPNNYFSTLVTPLGGFYYADSFNFNKPYEAPKLIDVTICILKEKHLEHPFLTHPMRDPDGNIIPQVSKIILGEEHLAEPDTDHTYFVCGNIHHKMRGLALHRDFVCRSNLRFEKKSGDYLIFNTAEKFVPDDWAGLSGSAIFDNEGRCVGVVCAVSPDTKSIWVLGMDKVRMLCDVAIFEEL